MAGLLIAKNVPPPNKLKRSAPGEGSPGAGEDEDESDEEGEDDAAGVSMMQEFMDAVKGGDAKEAYEAFCRLQDSH